MASRNMYKYLLIVCLALAGGCAGMMIGGPGGVAWEPGKDARPASVVAEDSAITTRVREKLRADQALRPYSLGVRTYEGRVTLSGEVGSQAAREQAGRLAAATQGVRSVDNRIRVATRS